ncbi:hypothetical protein ASG88_01005 [Nocardioides sp. Soil777]|uniref:PspA-associated protein PspAB n=1 Tax=Nocardioides sp. Soil777 TaxID=1736409 RepID=UPI00070336B6|nr:hypothetical protein [Nocardioides sp. Soil777]KRF07456.1 hypothetical protein ASG88_01005 [Nocardioides sp. Soil777]
MRWLDAVTGRRRQAANNLDALFLVPSAAITLETAAGYSPTGVGSVCYRSAPGAAFDRTQEEIKSLLDDDPEAPDVTISADEFGFTWLVVRGDATDTAGLCTDLHTVNTLLEEQGFASGLLCSMVTFAGHDRTFGLVYLYKQGTFYAFAPTGPHQRDNLTEIAVRDHLAAELPMERDMQRWLALWNAPGL